MLRAMLPVIRAVRLHQWVKNLLIFVPLVLSHRFTDTAALLQAGLGFFAFGLCASAMYLINDLVDLEADRQHPDKRRRPFAAGELSVRFGLLLAPLLLLAGFGLAGMLSLDFLGLLLGYVVLTLLYTAVFKTLAVLDVIVLAGLYTLRIVAGAFAIQSPVTYWLLAFSLFLFFSLALVKRYSELFNLEGRQETRAQRRGYHAGDLPLVSNMGLTSAYLSVLIFALYLNEPDIQARYANPVWLWIVTPALLYWLSRIWLLASRGRLHEDPVLFAVRDTTSYLVAGIVLAAVLLAI